MTPRSVSTLLLLCIVAFPGLPALAKDEKVEQVVLVLWHGLRWSDLDSFQFDTPLGLGFLNTRGGGGEAVSGSYLSIGAGARAVGLSGAAGFYQGEQAGKELYRRHTGLEPTSIVQPKIAQIRGAQTVNYRIEPGALGTAFIDADLPLRVLGNSDGIEPYAWAALVGMDGRGRVWEGSIGSEFTILDPSYPYGLRTDYGRLLDAVLSAEETLVIVDLGDPFRLDQYQSQLVESQRQNMRRLIVQEANLFVDDVVRNSSTQTVVLLISPYPAEQDARKGFWLTPALCWGVADGLLTSGTTRWPGLITNMDVAPTILKLLEIEHRQPFIGRPAFVAPASVSDAVTRLESMAGKIEYLSRYRGQVLRAVVIAQILTYSAVLVVLIVSTFLPDWAVRTLQLGLLLLIILPFGLLLWSRAPLIVLLSFVIICFLRIKGFGVAPLVGIICAGTTVTLIVDVLLGSWLMRYSFLGYDPIGGARFYGLGNEFMGVLVGSTLMAWATFVEHKKIAGRWRNALGILLFGLVTLVVGLPSLGTNVGGAISAVVGFGFAWITFAQKRIRWHTVVTVALATILVLGVLMLIDSANSHGEQSHIGQTVELVRRDGPAALVLIIIRKLSMNLKLLRYSMWSNALIVALVGMGASFIWPSKYICWLKENHPFIAKGIVGVVIASTAAFLFNDSGVVAAATCLGFASSTLLLLALELKHDFVASQTHIQDDGDSH